MSMRGLTVFIADLRNCRVRELEEKRINKEMANIRAKFKEGNLNGYSRKKYICKLLYIYILGWDIDFGHMEAVTLISSRNFSEKQIGYLAVILLLTENHELVRLVVNSIRKDLEDLSEINNCLALHAIANIGAREMAESLAPEVYKLLISPNSKSFAKKKAALTLLRIFRKHPDVFQAEDWAPRIVALMDEIDLGVAQAVTTLVLAASQQYPDSYKDCVPKAIGRMQKIVIDREYSPDYVYYKVPVPWFQCKLLRLLHYYPPSEDRNLRSWLNEVLKQVIGTTQEMPKNVQHNNAQNAVLFEAISLAIHLDPESDIVKEAAVLLGRFIASKETNIRYLALDAMARLAAFSESLEPIKKHQETIIQSLRDRDISVRRRGLDLLYSMCDNTNTKEIVSELLRYLSFADYAIREEMVLKIAILAEKFATENSWYVDVVLQLITTAGDHVGDEVWYRVAQIVTNDGDLQEYAARMALNVLRNPGVHETAVKIAGYVLGEFGHLIANQPGCAPIVQFTLLHSKFSMCQLQTRALLLTAYIKFVNLFPEIKQQILAVFDQYRHVLDVEIQQRACDYAAIARMPTDDVLQTVCEEMPPFPERESALLSKIQKKSQDTEDKRTWNVGGKDANRAAYQDARQATKSTSASPISGGGSAQVASSAGTAPASVEQDLLGLIDFGGALFPPRDQLHPTPLAGAGPSAPGDAKFGPPVTGSEKWYEKLVYMADGVLFEDDVLQIGLKSEYQNNVGRLAMYFGNKTQSQLQNFSVATQVPPEVAVSAAMALASTIAPVTQVQQLFNIECRRQFSAPVLIRVAFTSTGGPQSFVLRAPVTLNKFVEPISLAGPDFFGRWKQIGGPPKEVQVIFAANSAGQNAIPAVKRLVAGFRFGVLVGVDPNLNNVVGAGILSVAGGKIGCLLRLEPNFDKKMFRLTVRSTDESVSETIKSLLVASLTTLV